MLTFLDEEPWRLWKEEEASSDDNGPQELNCDGNSVAASVEAVLCGIHDTVGQENANGDAELVTSYQSSSNLLWCDFRHVENDDRADETDAGTADDTADGHDGDTGRCGFQDTSDGEDEASCDDCGSSTNEISDVASHDGAEEGSGGEDGGGEGLLPGRELEVGLVGGVRG